MSWLVGSLLVSALFSAAFCGSPETKLVEKLISYSNRYCREHKISEIELEGFVEKPVTFGKGKLSGIDNLLNAREPIIDPTPYKNGVSYYYNLLIGMKKMTLSYPFEIVHPTANATGTFSIDAGKASFHADGHVYLGNDGSCSALLENVYVYKMDNDQGQIDAKDIPIAQIRQLYEGIINGIMAEDIRSEVGASFDKLEENTGFKKIFNDIVCSGLKEYA